MIDQIDEQDSSQFDAPYSNMILYQQFSPMAFRINPSPHHIINHDFYQEQEEYFPFDNQPLQKMFDPSPQESPSMKQVVIKQSVSQIAGFHVVRVHTNHMTPQHKREVNQRRYYSDRNDKKMLRLTQEPPQRSSKGLRNLSVKVRDIVLEMKSTSYKDVAERLIFDLGQDGTMITDLDNSKDEQNIKRRVYDALNVMIASKVLRKEGKKVLSDLNSHSKHKSKKSEREAIYDELNQAKKTVEEKRKQLTELYMKVLGLKNLIERNKKNQEQMHKFIFPILMFTEQTNKVNLSLNNKVLKIRTQKKLSLQADLDILVSTQMYKNNIDLICCLPKEIIQHLQNQVKEFCLAQI